MMEDTLMERLPVQAVHGSSTQRASSTVASAPPRTSIRPARRPDLDWLRAGLVLGLIPFHTAVIFNVTTTLFIKNAQRSYAMDVVGAFMLMWGMPLLFLIAGAAAWFALGRRGWAGFVRERALRLLVPFVFATFVIIPVQIYIILCSAPSLLHGFSGNTLPASALDSYGAFYPRYLAAYLAFFAHYSVTMAMVFFGHLWFIPRLFVDSLLCLPLFVWLRTPTGRAVCGQLAIIGSRRVGLYLVSLPFGVSEVLLRPGGLDRVTRGWPVYDVWAEFSMYLLYFALGFVLYSQPKLLASVRQRTVSSFALGVVSLGILQALAATGHTPAYGATLASVAYLLLRGFMPVFWVLGVLGLALHVFTRATALLRYLSEAVLPIYVLHLPILTLVAFDVVRWPLSATIKFAVIAVATLALTLAVYEVAVRRVPPVRLLFGMRLGQASATQSRRNVHRGPLRFVSRTRARRPKTPRDVEPLRYEQLGGDLARCGVVREPPQCGSDEMC